MSKLCFEVYLGSDTELPLSRILPGDETLLVQSLDDLPGGGRRRRFLSKHVDARFWVGVIPRSCEFEDFSFGFEDYGSQNASVKILPKYILGALEFTDWVFLLRYPGYGLLEKNYKHIRDLGTHSVDDVQRNFSSWDDGRFLVKIDRR